MEIITMGLSELNPASYNPRKQLAPGDEEYEQIKRSIETFGLVEPIVWNRRTGNVVGGHQRLTVLRDLGHETASVSVIDIDDAEEKALNIALNKITGEWDDEKLSALLEELAENADGAVELTGFTEAEMEELFSLGEIDLDGTGGEDDDFDIGTALEEAAEKPIAKRGDIYLLGGAHRLMCGDSTIAGDVAALMDGSKAKLTVTDPPYNVNYGDKSRYQKKRDPGRVVRNTILNDNQTDAAFRDFLLAAFTNIHGFSEDGAAAYIFHADTEGLNFRGAFEDAGFKVRQCLVWVKDSLVLGRQDYQWRHEPILYGWKAGKSHYFIEDRTQTTVFEHERPKRSEEHPTMKPVPLIERIIANSSKKGWLVYDPFGGSGSTLIAAERLSRCCCMMELDERYCDVIVRRYIENAGGEVILIRDGNQIPYSEVGSE